jgi:hypothetical protein
VPRKLKAPEQHDGLQVSNVEGVSGWVKPAVETNRALIKSLRKRVSISGILQQTPKLEFLEQFSSRGHS